MRCNLKTETQLPLEGLVDQPQQTLKEQPQKETADLVDAQRKQERWRVHSEMMRRRNTDPKFLEKLAERRKELGIGSLESAVARLKAKTKLSANGCLEWTGKIPKPSFKHKKNLCYPLIRVCTKKMTIHRLSYLVNHGPIPTGMCVLHHCDNPICCLPEHLFLGTQKDNVQDCIRKGRSAARDSKNVGEDNPNSTITFEIAKKMRAEYVWRKVTCKMLGEKYGVHKSVVHGVVSGRRWMKGPGGA